MKYRVAWCLATTAAMAFSFGQVSAVAGPVASSRVTAVVVHTNAPTDPTDKTKVPHYFGPYPNWANTPQVLSDAIVGFAGGGGSGATATATVDPKLGGITGFTVTSPGTGYTAPPTVAITAPGITPKAPASATAAISAGVVTSFAVAAPGARFTTPSVTLTGGGFTTPATAKASGGVDNVVLSAPGSGYTLKPIVKFSLPNLATGTEPTATATMDAAGNVNGISMVTPGSGYTSAPTITILDGTLVNPTAGTAVATIAISQIDVVAGGTGYTAAPTVAITDSIAPFDKGAIATATIAALGAVTAVTVTAAGAGYLTPGLRKFVDTLSGFGAASANDLGQYIPIAVPDTTTYPGTDYYEIAVVQYRMTFHTDLPATLLRGYVQLSTNVVPGKHSQLTNANLNPSIAPAAIAGRFGVDDPHYLGPTIVATKDKPVRILFRNLLPTGVGGDLFLPVDTTIMGSGAGPDMMTLDAKTKVPVDMVTDSKSVTDGVRNPMCGETPKPTTCYSENRATLHLHGGITPWISDGTPHQWITPAGENTAYPAGVSVHNVPDMADPGPGAETFFYTNQQSARLMFYHDHSWGITRLNVYAGEAAGYLVTDPMETSLTATGGALAGLGLGTPLIIEDKTFVPKNIALTDPTWNAAKWGGEGNLWAPHVYMPAQNPGSPSGASPFGRWMYGPWFWPPATAAKYPPIPNPYYDSTCDPNVQPFCEPQLIPSTPNVSVGMEAFNDTPIVNGTAYPTTAVDPKAYRYRILNASNDRFWNLQWYVADPTTGTLSEVALNPAELLAAQTDPQVVPTPDLAKSPAGPSWVQIGTEGGFLPAPAIVTNQPITWITDPTRFDFGNVDKHALLIAPAERADVVVDFSQYQGKTLILYNDAPAAFPARQANMDYYTGAPDMTASGGVPSILPGYGPNTRTIMQVKVSTATPAVQFDKPNTTADRMGALNAAFAHHTDTGGKPAGVFEAGSDPIIVGQAAYNSAYGSHFVASGWCTGTAQTSAKCDGFARIQQQGKDPFIFDTLGTTPATTPGPQLSIPLQGKGIHDEMNSANFDEWGRMTANMGLEAPGATPLLQNIILYPYVNPPTEELDSTALPSSLNVTPISSADDGTQIWKITHNGVDTHPIHFHLYDVQVLNRVTWDNIIMPPDANELGWKETVRLSPLEDTYVAVRPIVPTLPFGLPDSIRPLNPAMPIGAMGSSSSPNGTEAGFNNTDVNGNPTLTPIANAVTNFGWEYMWHCHILSHEEMDMMRPVTVAVARKLPVAPVVTLANSGAINLSWTDGTPVVYTSPASWTLAGAAVGTAEIGYRIERAGSDGTYAPLANGNVPANTTTFTDYSASTGGPFSYEVVAYNAAGDSRSDPTTPAVPTASTIPAAPVIGTATAWDAAATVTWTAPADGGSPILGYSVQAYSGATGLAVGAPQAAAAGTTNLMVTGLVNGTAVKFQVQATNAVGVGPFSALSNVVTPLGVPGAPVIGTAVPGNSSATVSWTAPANIGGSPITSYSVKVVDALTNAQVGALQPAAAGATSLAVTGLVNGTSVAFQVQATNLVGSGPFSALSSAVTPAAVPGTPRIGTATGGNASAVLTWSAPVTGGSPITGYAVKVLNAVTNAQVDALQPAAAGATSLTVTGLVNGTAVAFAVQAINAIGSGPFSILSNVVTPVTVPAAPLIGTAIAGEGAATVIWTAPANGGSAITGYLIRVVNVSTTTQVGGLLPAVAGATSMVVTGLVNGTAVAFQIQAISAVGPGGFSALSNTVIPGAINRYVIRVYRDLFNRAPDPAGLSTWITALQNGTPRIAVANAMTGSTEYRSALISKSYQTYLGRLPDPAGLANWLNVLGSGSTIQQMESGFVASNEYYAQGGSTDSGWVTKLYRDVLGRQAGSSEIAYWVGQLNGGASRTQVSMGFLLSTEHLSAVIDGYYMHFLGRHLDPNGQQTWVSAIQAGARTEQVIGGIIASAEYYALP